MTNYRSRNQSSSRNGYKSNNNAPANNQGNGQSEFGDQDWKMTKFRYGRCRYMCPTCDNRNFNLPDKVVVLPNGFTRVSEVYCPACKEGNICINNIYRKYFSRQANDNQSN
ncbi:hypothetical protein AAVH_25236 [Aphelenchoides avenae]|nr:hypothetical protein AAVH_25236 [Aphelenchus avenae]